MNRREALKQGAAGCSLVALTGGVAWARHTWRVDRLEQQLITQAEAVAGRHVFLQLQRLPVEAREQILLYFDGVCLDAHGFTSEVCSARFRESLGRRTPAERQRLLVAAFERHVVTAAAVLNKVRAIADEIGRKLDDAWQTCCNEVVQRWNVPLHNHEVRLSASAFVNAVEPAIRASLRQSIESAGSTTAYPALIETALGIGASIILLLPVCQIAPYVGWLLCAAVGLAYLADYVLGLLQRPEAQDLQRLVTGRLAELGRKVATQFEQDVRRQITALQAWQNDSLRTAALAQAAAAVGWF